MAKDTLLKLKDYSFTDREEKITQQESYIMSPSCPENTE